MRLFSRNALLINSKTHKAWRRDFKPSVFATLTGDWTSITYGNGKYLAKNDDYLSTSPDGINWGNPYQVSNNTFAYSKYLMYNGSFFIAVGDKETVETSSDGINWTTQQTSGFFDPDFIKSAFYNGTKFVVFDPYSYKVYLSADGLQWERKSDEIIANGTHLAFNGEKYIVSRSNGYIAISTDLINWTNIKPTEIYGEFTTNMYLGYDGTRFFGIYGSNISYSIDGINWTAPVNSNLRYGRDWTDSITDNIKTVLISSEGYISTKRI